MARPPFYKTVEELQAKIDEYFDSCVTTFHTNPDGSLIFDKQGQPIVKDRNPPTITGLAFHLGFSSRQSIQNYQSKRAFVDVIARAKLRVENFNEKQVHNPEVRPQGVTFVLFNMGWQHPGQQRAETINPEEVAKENRDRYKKLFGEFAAGGAR